MAILPSLLLSWYPARGGQPWTCTSVLSLPVGIASCSSVVAYGPEDGPRTLTGPRPGRRLDSQLCPNCVFCAHRQRRPSHRSATEKGEQAHWGMAGCPVWVGSGTEAPPVFSALPGSLGKARAFWQDRCCSVIIYLEQKAEVVGMAQISLDPLEARHMPA